MGSLLVAVEKGEVDPDGFIDASKNSLAGEMGSTRFSHGVAV
jgi:hypothetical protein